MFPSCFLHLRCHHARKLCAFWRWNPHGQLTPAANDDESSESSTSSAEPVATVASAGRNGPAPTAQRSPQRLLRQEPVSLSLPAFRLPCPRQRTRSLGRLSRPDATRRCTPSGRHIQHSPTRQKNGVITPDAPLIFTVTSNANPSSSWWRPDYAENSRDKQSSNSIHAMIAETATPTCISWPSECWLRFLNLCIAVISTYASFETAFALD